MGKLEIISTIYYVLCTSMTKNPNAVSVFFRVQQTMNTFAPEKSRNNLKIDIAKILNLNYLLNHFYKHRIRNLLFTCCKAQRLWNVNCSETVAHLFCACCRVSKDRFSIAPQLFPQYYEITNITSFTRRRYWTLNIKMLYDTRLKLKTILTNFYYAAIDGGFF